MLSERNRLGEKKIAKLEDIKPIVHYILASARRRIKTTRQWIISGTRIDYVKLWYPHICLTFGKGMLRPRGQRN